MTKKKGRPAKNHVALNGHTINGLTKRTDGRWKIISTGYLFTCHDEAEAIRIFHKKKAQQKKDTITLCGPPDRHAELLFDPDGSITLAQEVGILPRKIPRVEMDVRDAAGEQIGEKTLHKISAAAYWESVGRAITQYTRLTAEKTGVKDLVNLASLPGHEMSTVPQRN